MLTAYDGYTITYDAIGNPLNYYNGSHWNFTWENGRNLAAATSYGSNITYTYDATGLRTSKTVGAVTYTYYYINGQLRRVTDGTNTTTFFCDESGKPFGMHHNGSVYYYVTNLQGDVLRLTTADGTVVARYNYDPYGKVRSATGSMATANPLRYRGYYYDSETGLYYLQSRYYDPVTGRFINADNYSSTGQGVLGNNMFAYCRNNPVSRKDASGTADVSCYMGDDTPWDDLVSDRLSGGGGGSYAFAYNPIDAGYRYGVDLSIAARSSVVHGGIYNNGYVAYSTHINPVGAVASSVSSPNGALGNRTQNTFLPDSFYSKHAPKQSTPYSSYTNYTYNNYTGKYEKSTAYYDLAGRQCIRIDWTNHGYLNHGVPHVHYTTYNAQYRDGTTARWD